MILMIYVPQTFAQETEEPYYVIARNGLIVRDQPSIKGKKLNKLPYRTEVKIKKYTGNQNLKLMKNFLIMSLLIKLEKNFTKVSP